jgi:hypothetical protein
MTETDAITRITRPHLINLLALEVELAEREGYMVLSRILSLARSELICIYNIERESIPSDVDTPHQNV